MLSISNATSSDEKLAEIVKCLSARGHTRTRMLKILASTVYSLFIKTLEQIELKNLIEALCARRYIVHENEIVSHRPHKLVITVLGFKLMVSVQSSRAEKNPPRNPVDKA